MKSKKIIALCLATVMGLSLAACTNDKGGEVTPSTTPGTEAVNPKDIKVAGVVYLEDQFMKLLSKGYEDAAKEAGVKCMISNVNNDQAKEANEINTYVSQGINGLAIAPLNEQSSTAAIKAAADKGMKIALTDGTLNDTSFILGGYTSDQKQLGAATGKVAAKFIEEKLDGKAKIAIVQFKSLLPEKSGDRVSGFLEEVQKLPGVEVIADQDAWVQDKAVSVGSDILTAHPDVDIIFAANDGGTVGSTMAVKNAGKAGEVFVFGIDASEQIAAMLKDADNILQAVTGQDAYGMGYNAMESLINDLLGKDSDISGGSIKTVDGVLLDRADAEGIETYLTDLKERTRK